MIDLSLTKSMLTLNINGLNNPIKRQKLSDWIKNQDLSICYPGETHFKYKEAGQLKG